MISSPVTASCPNPGARILCTAPSHAWRGGVLHCHVHVRHTKSAVSAGRTEQSQLPEPAQIKPPLDVDIHSPYRLSKHSIESYQRDGFVSLPAVFNEATLSHYKPTMSLEVSKADKTPLEDDSDYQKAFTQVIRPCSPVVQAYHKLIWLHCRSPICGL